MANRISKQKSITLSLDTSELSENQVRLVRGIHHLLTTVLKTDEESEYFDSSAELMKLVASAVKQANFGSGFAAECENIEYTQQALEFSLDMLSDHIFSNKLISYDN